MFLYTILHCGKMSNFTKPLFVVFLRFEFIDHTFLYVFRDCFKAFVYSLNSLLPQDHVCYRYPHHIESYVVFAAQAGTHMHVATLRSTSATRDIFLPHCSEMKQAELRRIWLDAPANRLCAWEVAKAVGLREASKEIHGGWER